MIDFSTVKSVIIPEGEVKQISIGDLILWKKAAYTNMLLYAEEATSTDIYNGGLGYKDGYRLNSSAVETELAGSTVTGYIPINGSVGYTSNIVRVRGLTWDTSTTNCYIWLFGSAKGNKAYLNSGNNGTSFTQADGSTSKILVTTGSDTDGTPLITFDLSPVTVSGGYYYFRIAATGSGADVVITVNEEIPATELPYTNQVPISIDTDGSVYNSGLGYKDGYRVRSGGAEAAITYGTITGFIPFKVGDTLRIYPPFTGENTTNAINFADASFTNFGQVTASGNAYGNCTAAYVPTITEGVTTYTLPDSASTDIAYVRITNRLSAISSGSEMIITVNEEIPL